MTRIAATSSVLVLTGAPGVGKSTVARRLAAELPLCAHVDADSLQLMIVAGGEWPSSGSEAAMRQLLLRTRNAALLAASFAASDIPVVLDEVLALPDQVTAVGEILGAVPWTVVGLSADRLAIQRRDAGRHKQTAANYEGIEPAIRRAVPGAPWLDTSDLSEDETVLAVRRLIGW